jgi:8-oxo-dGTP pyrophosphatase MutT (NUDIX family)
VSDVSQSPTRSAASALHVGPFDVDETLVDLRCSVIIFRQESVLLLHRTDSAEWVLPGGRPRPGESMVSCARREVHEETGLSIAPGRCALVLEVASPDRGSHIVELVFLVASVMTDFTVHAGEPGRVPVCFHLAEINSISLRPPIGGHLRSLSRDSRASAAYLGNVWRPAAAGEASTEVDGPSPRRSDP